MLLACAIGIPAAVWAARRDEAARIVLPTASFLQTIPSLALFGLMLACRWRELGELNVTVGTALLFCGVGLVLALGCGCALSPRAGPLARP